MIYLGFPLKGEGGDIEENLLRVEIEEESMIGGSGIVLTEN